MSSSVQKILLIEDNADDVDLIGEMLSWRVGEYTLATAALLSSALELVEKDRFAAILLDLGLPDSSGIDTLRRVQDKAPNIPIIVLTCLADEELPAKALSLGAQDYLTKGRFDSNLLLKTIRFAIERNRAEEALRGSKNRYHMLFNAIDEGFCIIEVIFDKNEKPVDYRFLEINPAFEKQTGLIDAQGKRMRELVPKHEEHWFETYGKIALTGQPARFQNRAEQLHRWYDVYAFRFGRPEDRQVAILFNDITERRAMEEEVTRMAQHDALTGLPNRRLFLEVAAVELAQARRNHRKLAIFFFDLDRFKEINDTFGHETGDELLKETARRLRAVVRTSDTVARIGGDEFNLIVSDIDQAEYASQVANKILREIRKLFSIKGTELNVSASIGISVFPDDSEEVETLLRYADIAMYYAKEHGRNTFQFYNPVINASSRERIDFENSLRRAIEREEFRLYFQPLVSVATGKLVSLEVLLRWQHPEQGMLLPEQFFKAAEDIGMMPEIDSWVLNAAGRQIKTWMMQGVTPICITVNVSARQFQKPDLVTMISGILKETGLPPECLELEITETTIMGNIENTVEHLRELTAMGVHVSIDDFGTGYSSLNQLKRLPIRKIKIDRSFVRDITTDANDRAIISAVTSMAHKMGIRTVAEGVETEEQLAFVRASECDEAQGFLFSRPAPAKEFRELVEAGR